MATYSFMDVSVSLVGPTGAFSLGYGEATAEEGIDVVRAGDKNTMTVAADGEGMHSLHADKSGQVTLRYLKTAPVNALLMAAYNAQTMDSRLHGKNVITVTNSASADLHTCRQCAFKKAPDMKMAKDADIVVWVFDAIKIDSILGTY
ncbi:DUF3277 family protein [Herbaspirillum frisingense]|uniref:phage protein n=1 Tax=Herbaspirillum frisingense TaxID=92645 RepID=UPI0015FEE5B1|nr:phage protein [Herbaspirillum frisingense]QNB08338.1 DUF3277 family protein [Herbaspirillum frisingense]